MEIKIFIGGGVWSGGVIGLHPAAGVKRQGETGQFRSDNTNGVTISRKTITECDALVAGREINFDREVIGVAKRQAAMIQNVIHMRLRSGEQVRFFALLFNFPDVIKSQRMCKVLMVTSQSEWRLGDHDFSSAGHLISCLLYTS